MKFLNRLFNKPSPKEFTKNYLRIYGNIDKTDYSEKEKKELIDVLISIANTTFGKPKLAFDINGSGYGISKGGGMLGIKAFQNRITKKGLKNLTGVSVEVKDKNYYSSFDIFTNEYEKLKRIDFEFSWEYTGIDSLSKAIDFIAFIDKAIEIEYAYSYPDDETLSVCGEWRVERKSLSVISFQPETEKIWNSLMEKIKDGKIKKVYPINLFNDKQKSLLNTETRFFEKISINGSREVWTIPIDKITKVQATNSII